MKFVNILSIIIPLNVTKKFKSLKIIFSLAFYRKLFLKEANKCGSVIRVYSPLSLKGLKYMDIGENFKFDKYGILEAWDFHNGVSFKPYISIGNNVSFGKNCHVGCINSVVISDNVLIGSNVLIIDHSHGNSKENDMLLSPNNRPLRSKGGIYIGKNVWIGEKVTILPGVKLGNNCIVGANSVVTCSFPDDCVIVGNPAKVVKKMNN